MPIKRDVTYPNARYDWHGCPMTCPDACPFEDCTMPGNLAAKIRERADYATENRRKKDARRKSFAPSLGH